MMNRFLLSIVLACLLAQFNVRAADTGKGGLRYSVMVSKFENEANWSGRWSLGDGFKTMMTAALNESGKFIALGDQEMRDTAMAEQDFAASGRTAGGKKTPKVGRMTPAQLLVRGSITHVQEKTSGASGGVHFQGLRLGGSGGHAEINMTFYMVDSATGQVKASKKIIGKSSTKGLNIGYHGGALGGLGGDFDGFKNDNMGKATEDCVAQAVEFMAGQLDKIPWEGSVVLAKGDKVIINRGTREGVSNGMKFIVGTAEEVVDPDTGEVLDSDITKVGELEVTEVKEKISNCKPLAGGNAIEKGMAVTPAN
jgi:curli biogenesis system outer membrane secretion channel CsgG